MDAVLVYTKYLKSISYYFVIIIFITPMKLHAGPWYIEPSISSEIGYNNNLRLDENTNDDDTWIMRLRTAAILGIKNEPWDVNTSLSLDINRYPSINEYDTNNIQSGFHAVYNTETSKAGLDYIFSRGSTLENFIDNTGTIDTRSHRKKEKVYKPFWKYSFDEVTTFGINGESTKLDYSEQDPVNDDFKVETISAYLNRQLSQTSSFTLSSYLSKYSQDSRTVDTVIDYEGINIGLNHAFNRKISITASIGRQNTDSKRESKDLEVASITQNKSQTDLYSLEIYTKSYLTDYRAEYSLQAIYDSQGNINEREEFKVNVTHRVNEKSSLIFDGRYFSQINISNDSSDNDRTFWSANVSYIFRYQPQAVFKIGYTRNDSKYRLNTRSATSDSLVLSFEYYWDKVYL